MAGFIGASSRGLAISLTGFLNCDGLTGIEDIHCGFVRFEQSFLILRIADHVCGMRITNHRFRHF